MRKIAAIVFFTCFCFCLHGQDNPWPTITSNYTFRGFSADGVYAAYEMNETLVHENDANLVQVFIVDVDKNSYATHVFRYQYDSAGEAKFKRAYDSAYRIVQNRFRIPGIYQGTALAFAAPVTVDSITTSYSFSFAQKTYAVVVRNIPVPGSEEYGAGEVMVQVDLVSNGVRKTLQLPQRAPKSWGMTQNYSLVSGWCFSNKIALFLNYENSGFEGPGAAHQMIVTGKL